MEYFDKFTGKRLDKLSDVLPEYNGSICEDCGFELINRCGRCGAPVCCPKCCEDAYNELYEYRIKENNEISN